MTVADSTTERILQATRAWLKLAATSAGLTNAQVIVADEPGPRPTGPYLTVKITAADVPVGTDYKLELLGDVVTVAVEDGGGPYEVSVNGTIYSAAGDTAAEVATALAALINEEDELLATASGATLTIGGAFASPTTTVGSPLSVASGAVPVIVRVGHRTTTVSIQGYGRETLAWLEDAFLELDSPAVKALNDAAGLSFRPAGGLTDLSSFLDTAFEHRAGRDVIATYKRHGRPSFAVALETVETTIATTGAPGEIEVVETTDLT